MGALQRLRRTQALRLHIVAMLSDQRRGLGRILTQLRDLFGRAWIERASRRQETDDGHQLKKAAVETGGVMTTDHMRGTKAWPPGRNHRDDFRGTATCHAAEFATCFDGFKSFQNGHQPKPPLLPCPLSL
ncbi:hypothetical protein FVF58_37740 [Paraburkholderia panacisoli]|uniref:Uncharacterized protein n=1 Tax=Paraburkholderia panacisoli TaxID=2603818 RepID=A0A5B0GGA8_9BURK|nr:hypothetical protein [Paraburkholderia panacisoli]KAA1002494.1 hypothetical protein FVF58_37740 [Paraburkholderia panacisoli]